MRGIGDKEAREFGDEGLRFELGQHFLAVVLLKIGAGKRSFLLNCIGLWRARSAL